VQPEIYSVTRPLGAPGAIIIQSSTDKIIFSVSKVSKLVKYNVYHLAQAKVPPGLTPVTDSHR
jgi:hypothetical protein